MKYVGIKMIEAEEMNEFQWLQHSGRDIPVEIKGDGYSEFNFTYELDYFNIFLFEICFYTIPAVYNYNWSRKLLYIV